MQFNYYNLISVKASTGMYDACQSAGTCTLKIQDSIETGICKPGYSGTYCDIKYDPCDVVTSQHCACAVDPNQNDFYCTCQNGWKGPLCEERKYIIREWRCYPMFKQNKIII